VENALSMHMYTRKREKEIDMLCKNKDRGGEKKNHWYRSNLILQLIVKLDKPPRKQKQYILIIIIIYRAIQRVYLVTYVT
jgi:hypothetical protein